MVVPLKKCCICARISLTARKINQTVINVSPRNMCADKMICTFTVTVPRKKQWLTRFRRINKIFRTANRFCGAAFTTDRYSGKLIKLGRFGRHGPASYLAHRIYTLIKTFLRAKNMLFACLVVVG